MNCFVEGCLNESRTKYKPSLCSKHNSAKWRGLNPIKNKELDKAQYAKDREKILAKNKSPERRKYKNMKSAEYRQKYPEKFHRRDRQQHEKISSRHSSLKRGAKDRGLELSITKDQHADLIKDGKCYYCEYSLPKTGGGLDRKDNSVGYVIDNLVPCCTYCNVLKSSLLSHDEMVEIIAVLKKTRNKKFMWDGYKTIGG